MGWIGRRHNAVKWYVPSSRRTAWKRRGYRLVRVATPEEDALFEAHGGVSPILLSHLEQRARAVELELERKKVLSEGPTEHGAGEATIDVSSPSVGAASPVPFPSRKRKRG